MIFQCYLVSESVLLNCQKKRAARKDRSDEETWQLSRFYPIIEVQQVNTIFPHKTCINFMKILF